MPSVESGGWLEFSRQSRASLAFRPGRRTARSAAARYPRGKKWQYRYDAVGNVLSVTDPRGSSTDYGTPYTTSLTYDSFDRLREQHIPKDSSVIAASEGDRFITKKTDAGQSARSARAVLRGRPSYGNHSGRRSGGAPPNRVPALRASVRSAYRKLGLGGSDHRGPGKGPPRTVENPKASRCRVWRPSLRVNVGARLGAVRAARVRPSVGRGSVGGGDVPIRLDDRRSVYTRVGALGSDSSLCDGSRCFQRRALTGTVPGA